MKEDEMSEWHHQLDGHEFEQAPGGGMDREAWRAAVHGVTLQNTGQEGQRMDLETTGRIPGFH